MYKITVQITCKFKLRQNCCIGMSTDKLNNINSKYMEYTKAILFII